MGQVIDIMARHLFKMMFVAPSILLVIASMAPEVQSREPQLSDMSGVAPFDDTATASLADILASTQDALERYQNQESRYNTPYSSHRRTGSNSAGSGSGSGSGSGTASPTYLPTSTPTAEPTPLATTPPKTDTHPHKSLLQASVRHPVIFYPIY